jgi:hypothetical protein
VLLGLGRGIADENVKAVFAGFIGTAGNDQVATLTPAEVGLKRAIFAVAVTSQEVSEVSGAFQRVLQYPKAPGVYDP